MSVVGAVLCWILFGYMVAVRSSQLNFPEFQHAFDVAGRGDEEMGREDLLDYGAHDRQRGAARQPASSFVLEPVYAKAVSTT